jgi:hypothetical protein
LEKALMRWHRGIALVALFLAWAVLAAWQFNEYQNECDAARQTLRRQSGSLMNAVVGGIRSHRRVGVFIQEQLQGALDELIHSADVLAASVTDSKGVVLLSAGRTKLLGQPISDESWLPEGLQTSREFQLTPPPSNSTGTPGMGGGMGMGMGMGRGRMQHLSDEMERDEGPFFQRRTFRSHSFTRSLPYRRALPPRGLAAIHRDRGWRISRTVRGIGVEDERPLGRSPRPRRRTGNRNAASS